MSQDSAPDLKPEIGHNFGANFQTTVPSQPIIVDSDSSSDFSPLEEICLDEVEKEISLELGDPLCSPDITSSQVPSGFVSPLLPTAADTTGRNPDEIQLTSDEEIAPLPLLTPRPIVSQSTSATQTNDFEFSNTFQKRATKSATKFTPYKKTRISNTKKPKNPINRIPESIIDFKRNDLTTQSEVPPVPPPMPLLVPPPNSLPPLFTPNYAMAAAATLSAAAFLQPFLQMHPPGFMNMVQQLSATSMPLVPPPTQSTDTEMNSSELHTLPQLIEGPSSTSDTFGNELGYPDTFSHLKKVSRKRRSLPTIKWRNSAQFREADSNEVFEPSNTSPAISTQSDPIPAFQLTHLRNQSTDTFDCCDTPDTTIPTFKTTSHQEPLFKLPSSPISHTSENSQDNSIDDRFVTYDANPTVACGRRVVEFTDLAPSTDSRTIEELAASIGPIENFEFHQGLLFSRATVSYFIPKHALQCRRKFHMLCLEGVHISCNFADTEISPLLKLAD